ncbi:MAG: hypothetical protein R2713_23350 [Ilumatobacteraceae bacterium]
MLQPVEHLPMPRPEREFVRGGQQGSRRAGQQRRTDTWGGVAGTGAVSLTGRVHRNEGGGRVTGDRYGDADERTAAEDTTMDVLITVSVIGVMVTLNALYVAAEFATVGSRRSRVQEQSRRAAAPPAGCWRCSPIRTGWARTWRPARSASH